MNLDDKTTNAISAADVSGQVPENVPTKSAKRRKSNGDGTTARKSKKAPVPVEEDSLDNTAPLTMGSGSGGARQRKKMLFEASDAGAPPSIALMGGNGHAAVDQSVFSAAEAATQRKSEPAPAIAMPDDEQSREPSADIASLFAPIADDGPASLAAFEPTPEPRASEPTAPIADMKGSVFQVATLVMRSAEAPEPEVTPEVGEQPGTGPKVGADDDADIAPAETYQANPAWARLVADEDDEAVTPTASEPEPVEVAPVSAAAAPAVAPESPAESEEVRPGQPAFVKPAPSPEPDSSAPDKAPVPLSRSQAIAARAARMSAQNGARPAIQPQQPTATAARPPEPQRPADLPVQAGDIYGYWTRVKNGRRFPSRSDFDAEQLADHWPNSMLLTCAKAGGNAPVTFSSVLRLGANRRSRPGEDLSITSMITEWILSTGGEAARAGKPVQDTEVFPTPDGTHAYKIVALPLSDHQTHVDHVLCHLSRS